MYLQKTATKTRLGQFLDSPALKSLSRAVVTGIAFYRALMGEWLVLLVCAMGGVVFALLQQHWRKIPSRYRLKLVFSSGMILGWVLLTNHLPAHALFFDTLENGLKTLFGRFGVTGVDNIPSWIGGVFRIIGIVFLAILAVRFGRSQEGEDEGARHIVGKAVVLIAGLLIFDALIELFVS